MFYKRCINRRNRDPTSIHRFQIKKSCAILNAGCVIREERLQNRGMRNSTGSTRYFPMPRVCRCLLVALYIIRASTRQTTLTVAENSLYRPDTFLSLWAPRTGVTGWNASVPSCLRFIHTRQSPFQLPDLIDPGFTDPFYHLADKLQFHDNQKKIYELSQ